MKCDIIGGMIERSIGNSEPKKYQFKEEDLFPGGKSFVGDPRYDIATRYLDNSPRVSETEIYEEWVLRAKTAAALTVYLDTCNKQPTRPDLAKAVLVANHPTRGESSVSSRLLATATRRLGVGKNGFSEYSVRNYANQYSQKDPDAKLNDQELLGYLALDVVSSSGAVGHVEDMKKMVGPLSDTVYELVRDNYGVMRVEDPKGLSDYQKFTEMCVEAIHIDPKEPWIDIRKMDYLLERFAKLLDRFGKKHFLGSRALGVVDSLGGEVNQLIDRRIAKTLGNMPDGGGAVILVGTNADTLAKLEIGRPQRNRIIIKSPVVKTPATPLVGRRETHSKIPDSHRVKKNRPDWQNEHNKRDAIDAKNAPTVEEINRLAQEYNELTASIYGYNKKLLRQTYIRGKNSVRYGMNQSFPNALPKTLDSVTELYGGLIFNQWEDNNDLIELAGKASSLRVEYVSACRNIKAGGTKPELQALTYSSFNDDLEWLKANFDKMLESGINTCKEHVIAVGSESIERVRGLLSDRQETIESGRKSRANDATQIEDLDAGGKGGRTEGRLTLSEVRDKADTVDWTVIPSYRCTPKDLQEIIVNASGSGGDKKVDKTQPIEERLQMILDWREQYGAELYYSANKKMDDSGNFYFVLNFEKDGKNYAIAENPGYGNATYVMAEHLMPLLEGESLFTVVRELNRKTLRSLSAIQVRHTSGEPPHSHKIADALEELSKKVIDQISYA